MKSSLIQFIEKYRDSKLSDEKLLSIFNKVDKNDFDRNKQETWLWFLKEKKHRQMSIIK